MTPAELDVVRLVGEGLANRDIATRLFVSPRTVQSHLTHVYTKLGLASRVQLAQETAAAAANTATVRIRTPARRVAYETARSRYGAGRRIFSAPLTADTSTGSGIANSPSA